MFQEEIRIGIIGADTKKSWAQLSHVPAINGLPGLKLAAVATLDEQSAREAAEAFGADRWFSDSLAMIHDDLIDVITIAVKVPAHRELVLAALNAGKAVYCESPLGRTVAETEEMERAVRAVRSRHTAIGLQAHLNPAVRRAAQLLSSGSIGRPLNARIVSSTVGFGPEMPSIYDYFNTPSSGANLLTITGGHTLDVVEAVLGPIIELDARTEILWPAVKLTDTGEESLRETADHINVLGNTRSGAVFTVDISAAEDARFIFEIRGSEGWITLTGGHPYGFQAGHLTLTSSIPFVAPDEPAVSGGFMGAAINVGEVYAHLVRDVHAGTYNTPGFEHALHNARLIDAVRRAAERGERQKITSLQGTDLRKELLTNESWPSS